MTSPARSSSRGDGRRRVLYLITDDISARFLRGQLAHLIGRGYEVSVATHLSSPPARFDDGVDVHAIDFSREPSPARDLRGLWVTIGLIRRLRPEIVNASTPKAGLIGMIAAWCCRVPRRVYVVRGLRFETMSGVGRHGFRMLERLASACATDVVYNSPSLLAVAERERVIAPGRGVVLGAGSGNGIDVARFSDLPARSVARAELDIAPDARVVGFVGRLTRDKGIVDLVESFKDDPGLIVLLVGDFEPGDPVPASTRRTIESRDHFVHVPWVADTRHVYPAMDVLAFPSYREGLPNVPLEAQLCGVPVVAYDSTGTVDAVYPDAGTVVPTGDRHALRSAVIHLLDDDRGRAELESGARAWVAATFERSKVWGELERLYG